MEYRIRKVTYENLSDKYFVQRKCLFWWEDCTEWTILDNTPKHYRVCRDTLEEAVQYVRDVRNKKHSGTELYETIIDVPIDDELSVDE